MAAQELVQELEEGVLWITLNRPNRLNALTNTMITDLRVALEQASVDDQVRVVVLTGAGRGFCAGGDVESMANQLDKKADAPPIEVTAQQLRLGAESARLLHEMPKPTIAMARGAVAGAGLSLALACDIAVASDTLKITSAFINVALSGDLGSTYFLTHRLGHRAREFALLSPVLKADEAKEWGLVNRVVSDDDLQEETRKLARKLAAGPGIAQGHIKANLNYAEQGATLAQLLDHESIRHIRCGATEDHIEAARAFLEKRPAVFRNR